MGNGLLNKYCGKVEIDGHFVKQFRNMRGLTPKQLATKALRGQKTIENWEAKGVINADIESVRDIATALEIEPEELLTIEFRQNLQRKAGKLQAKKTTKSATPPPPSTTSKPCNLPPSIGSLFKGRDPFMAKLRAKLGEAGVKAAAITPRQAIHGLGGIGKTQLAVEFGWRHFDHYNALLYVFADSPTTLLNNLAQLTGVLHLPERELAEDARRAEAVIAWLNANPNWLLLIDSVDTDEAEKAAVDRLAPLHGGHIVSQVGCRAGRITLSHCTSTCSTPSTSSAKRLCSACRPTMIGNMPA